jgi:hypothetical protein
MGTRLGGSVRRIGAAGYAAMQQLVNSNGGMDSAQNHHPRSVALTVEGQPSPVLLPIHYHRANVFMAVFSARYDALARLLPSGLRPLRLGRDGRAPLAVSALNYLDSSIGTYREVSIATPCTMGSTPSMVTTTALALQSLFPTFGYFVLYLPVSTELALRVGEQVWGYPKFVANMDFERTPICQRVHLSESDQDILHLTVAQRGVPVPDPRPFVTYSTLGRRLLRTTIPTTAVYQMIPGGRGATLELGDHPISGRLRTLGLSGTPLFSLNYLSFSAMLPLGRTVGLVEERYTPLGVAETGAPVESAPPAPVELATTDTIGHVLRGADHRPSWLDRIFGGRDRGGDHH